jgi:hypothetical protein
MAGLRKHKVLGIAEWQAVAVPPCMPEGEDLWATVRFFRAHYAREKILADAEVATKLCQPPRGPRPLHRGEQLVGLALGAA